MRVILRVLLYKEEIIMLLSKIDKANISARNISTKNPTKYVHVMTKKWRRPKLAFGGWVRQKMYQNGWETNAIYFNGVKIDIESRLWI